MPLPRPAPGGAGACYTLTLPLISDGRIAVPLFLANPGLVGVERHLPGNPPDCGTIALQDGQWTCRWPTAGGQEARIIATSYNVGDLVGIRPQGQPMSLFRVVARVPASGEVAA